MERFNPSRRQFLQAGSLTGVALAASPAFAQTPRRIIVDSQMHLWRANSPERPWTPGSRPQTPEPMTYERALAMMDDAGVDRLVIVPPSLEGVRVDYGQEAARRHPGRFATMGRVALDDPLIEAKMATWRNQPAVLGVRLNIGAEQLRQLNNGAAKHLWPAAEKAGVPIMFLASGHMPLFAKIAERHPQLTLIVDHMGISAETMHAGKTAETVAETAALARYPNVSVKLSSIPLFSKEDYPWRDVMPHVRRLFDVYGPRRSHWGTDATNSFDKAAYRQRVTQFTEQIDFMSADDMDWVMGRSILERLCWT